MIERRTTKWIAAAIGAAVLTIFFTWVLFVPAADWLARHDIGNSTGASLETARNNARGNLLALTAGIAGFGALLFTASNFALQRRTYELAEQGQVTDRYTKAIEQLGSEKLAIRIGGIYALERIARDSARDYPSVMEVLTAFIREHSPAGETSAEESAVSGVRVQADMQVALSVIGRRKSQGERIRLTSANLAGVDLAGLAMTCWLGGAGRFSSSRKAVRFAGLDVTVYSSDGRRSPGHLSRQGPEILRWVAYEAAKTHARASAPGHDYYAAVKDRADGKIAALAQARKLIRQACHILAELGDDALTAA